MIVSICLHILADGVTLPHRNQVRIYTIFASIIIVPNTAFRQMKQLSSTTFAVHRGPSIDMVTAKAA